MNLDQGSMYYTFTFQKDDWGNNLARTMMDTIKSLPKGERSYSPITKQWKVKVSDNNKAIINKSYADWQKGQPTDLQLDLYDEEVDEFLHQFD